MGFLYAANVIADTEDFVALFQPPGAPGKRRTGRRGGPQGRTMERGGWDGGHQDFTWPGPGMLRLHPIGGHYSVLRRFDPEGGCYRGWYVNLERSWRRTPVGFDSRDDVLDVVVADDLSTWGLKDEDELAWSVESGKFSADETAEVRRVAAAAVARIEERAFPFTEDAYCGLEPDSAWALPQMPDAWASPFGADALAGLVAGGRAPSRRSADQSARSLDGARQTGRRPGVDRGSWSPLVFSGEGAVAPNLRTRGPGVRGRRRPRAADPRPAPPRPRRPRPPAA